MPAAAARTAPKSSSVVEDPIVPSVFEKTHTVETPEDTLDRLHYGTTGFHSLLWPRECIAQAEAPRFKA
ncbi:hypothetical protein EYR41_009662 [Orbilia oligospora]|uniref:Uncharacterized protein n=1 Tax=Orbilia oligospora TaxID=2813651 RepID=A0A8H2HNP1_ORBOL|nr:hypothetical protein EYR41_009662 [Orbilia oligospora]